jgi:tRNA A-37 threonylcarbamoyl transferase component Bud32
MATPDPNGPGGAAAQAAADLVHKRIGSTIGGRYRVVSLIGEGGMGAVYLVEHTLIRKRMALKVLNPDLMQNPEMVTRFEREALAAAHLDHPNVVAATDLGRTEDGALFLVLEYVDGSNLRDILSFGPMPAQRVLHIARQVTSALVRAHALRIVHRDLKPENIMLAQREGDVDFVKVLDFGLAKVRVEALLATEGDVTRSEALTRHGTIFGTPTYMAPEQAVGAEVDGRTDLYSLGIIMYELLTGEPPFPGDDPSELLKQHVIGKVPPLTERAPALKIPAVLDQLIMRLLEKRPDKRPQEARVVLDTIDQIAASEGLRFEPSSALHRMVMPTSGPIVVGGAQRHSASDEATVMRPPGAAASDPLAPTPADGVDRGRGAAGGDKDPSSSGRALASALPGLAAPGAQGAAGEVSGATTVDAVQPGGKAGGEAGAPKLRAPSVVDLAILRPDTANPAVLAPAPPPTVGERLRATAKEAGRWSLTVGWPALRRGAAVAWTAVRTHLPVWWRGLLGFIRPRLPPKMREVSQTVLGLAVAAVLVLPLLLLVLLWPGGEPARRPPPPMAAMAGFASDREMERGVEQGVPALQALVAKYPKDSRCHRALVRAQAAKKNYVEALRALVPLLQLDPSTPADEAMGQVVADAALVPETSDSAIAFLETAMGEHGVDILIDLADRTTMEPWHGKFSQSLTKEGVRRLASPEAVLLLDLRAAARCDQKKALLSRAGQHGGARVQKYLRSLQVNTGCGPGGQNDCWPCLRKGTALQSAITAIDQRGGQPG